MLARGKHVLLEKPLCLTVAEGEALAELAQSKGRVLAVVHNFQFARSAQAALAALAAGRWGRLTGLHAMQMSNERRRLPDWYEQLPGGLFYDESPHLLYLLRAFGGRVTLRHANLLASSRGKRTPALVQAQFDCERCPATLWMNFEAPVSEWHLLVFAERGLGIVDIFRDILHFVPNDGRHGPLDIARSSRSLVRDHVRGFWSSGWRTLMGRMPYGNDEVVKRFFDAIEGVAPLAEIGPEAALEVLRLQHALLEYAPATHDSHPLTACAIGSR
jgi:scyllo-inositol 2-dehydrogenase (NADP+)